MRYSSQSFFIRDGFDVNIVFICLPQWTISFIVIVMEDAIIFATMTVLKNPSSQFHKPLCSVLESGKPSNSQIYCSNWLSYWPGNKPKQWADQLMKAGWFSVGSVAAATLLHVVLTYLIKYWVLSPLGKPISSLKIIKTGQVKFLRASTSQVFISQSASWSKVFYVSTKWLNEFEVL